MPTMTRTSDDSTAAVDAQWTRPDSTRAVSNDDARPPRRCRKCGRQAVADENRCRSCAAFLPGNQTGLIHGSRRRTMADPRESELYQEWAADLGGEGELTAAQRAVLCRAVEADAICRTAFSYLEGTQESVAAERVQKALAVLAQHAGNVYRGAKILGLRRMKREVTLEDRLRDHTGAPGTSVGDDLGGGESGTRPTVSTAHSADRRDGGGDG